MIYGRWQAVKTARTYINSGLAAIAEMKLPRSTANRQFRNIFLNSRQSPLPSLEPTRGRAGGGGKKRKRTNRREGDRKFLFLYVVQFLLTNKVLRSKKGWTDRGLSLYIYIYTMFVYIYIYI